ncbi:hypothetical protein [Actinacidiphila sp. bgisy167]|uniref:hypothetical protein n=1 Tax=Actinacidiphila sp. bgisy167 TaxID=3413797 RepID=UPI003D71AF90
MDDRITNTTLRFRVNEATFAAATVMLADNEYEPAAVSALAELVHAAADYGRMCIEASRHVGEMRTRRPEVSA